MTSLRVLFFESQPFQRCVPIKALQQLKIADVIKASDCEQVMALLLRRGRVDILFCYLSQRGIDCIEFLSYARQLNLAKTVVLSFELLPNLSCTIWHMPSIAGLKFIGVLSKQLELRNLRHILRQYEKDSLENSDRSPISQKLPSEHEVRRGIEAGEFHAWYQPKINMRSGHLVSVEALVRWQHPVRGLIMPKDFLSAILTYDLFDDMFKHMLEQGLILLSRLRRLGLTLELAFNLHASQLADRTLSSHIKKTLDRYKIPASTLMFELVENGLLNAPLQAQENLMRLRPTGCGLSIDDFGVGFSSLTFFGELPFNQIKLGGGATEINDAHSIALVALVASSQALARALNMSLAVKGVNSQNTRDRYLNLRCSIGQWLLLGSPHERCGFMQWLGSRPSKT